MTKHPLSSFSLKKPATYTEISLVSGKSALDSLPFLTTSSCAVMPDRKQVEHADVKNDSSELDRATTTVRGRRKRRVLKDKAVSERRQPDTVSDCANETESKQSIWESEATLSAEGAHLSSEQYHTSIEPPARFLPDTIPGTAGDTLTTGAYPLDLPPGWRQHKPDFAPLIERYQAGSVDRESKKGKLDEPENGTQRPSLFVDERGWNRMRDNMTSHEGHHPNGQSVVAYSDPSLVFPIHTGPTNFVVSQFAIEYDSYGDRLRKWMVMPTALTEDAGRLLMGLLDTLGTMNSCPEPTYAQQPQELQETAPWLQTDSTEQGDPQIT